MTIAQEEIFGPFLSVLDYEDHEEAIHIANDTDYGLAAGVFTKDVDMATKTASRLNGGQVYVNSWFTGSMQLHLEVINNQVTVVRKVNKQLKATCN